MDDSHTIQTNQFVHSLDYLGFPWTSSKAYSSTPDNYGYRPLTTNFNQMVWALGDGEARAYQIAKKLLLVLFAAIAVLLWSQFYRSVWKRELSPLTRFLAFGFFLLHPLGTQVGNYIAASSSLLCGIFYAASLTVYLRYRQTTSWVALILGCTFFFFSMMSKEEGITLLGVILWLEVFYLRPAPLRLNWQKGLIGFFAYVLTAGLGLYLIFSHFEPSSNIARGFVPRNLYFATQLRAYFHYIGLYVWPFQFNFDNLEFRFAAEFWTIENLSFFLANLGIIFLGLYWSYRKKIWGIALIGFYIAIAPASSFISLAEAVNDHRHFISFLFFGIGLISILDWILIQFCHQEFRRWAGIAFIFLFLAGASFYRNLDFHSGLEIWLDTVIRNPHSPRAKNNLALEYISRHDLATARSLLEKCIVEAPTYAVCYTNLGIVNSMLGHAGAAEKNFEIAMRVDMGVVTSRLFYAEFLVNKGELQKAKKYLIEADEFASGLHQPVHQYLKLIKQRLGEPSSN